MQIHTILNNLTKQSPKILTVYQGHSFLEALSNFEVYCLVVPGVCDVRHPFPLNVCPVSSHNGIEFDLCVSFSGGLPTRILNDIARDKKIDHIRCEMDYVSDMGSDLKYIASGQVFPTNSFLKKTKGKGDIVLPYSPPQFKCLNDVASRPINACTIGDFLIESETSSNFSDWHYIVNTIGSSVFGFNPRMGTNCPNILQLVEVFNSTKVYINTRISGYFPLELCYAMACGCAVISYEYPGIEDIIPPAFVVKNKEECRVILSKMVSNPDLLRSVGQTNLALAEKFKKNGLTDYINKKWQDTYERGFEFYRI